MVGVWMSVVGCSPDPMPADPVREEVVMPLSVDVMTFNIRYGTANDGPNSWPFRATQVLSLIAERSPDFVGIQEAFAFQREYLATGLSGYQSVGRTRETEDGSGEGVPIFYRADRWRLDPEEQGTFWLSDAPETPGSTGWGNSIPRIVTWGRFTHQSEPYAIYVYNTHFDHRSREAQEKGAGLLAQRIAARSRSEPVIVTGDLNVGEDSKALQALLFGEEVLVDSFRVVFPAAEEVGTFHAFGGGRSGEKIDYVLIDHVPTVAAAEIIIDAQDGRYPSDHFPVSARLIYAPPD